MRYQLLTHYQLAALTEEKIKRLKKSEAAQHNRKVIALRILDQIYSISDVCRASVLTNHETKQLEYANRLKRLATRYMS
jgi:hypothetical protein